MWDFWGEVGTLGKDLVQEIHQPEEVRCRLLRRDNEPHDRT